jgi:hypothetical protein
MIRFSDMLVLSAVENRRQSLIEDGYNVLFEHHDKYGYYVKLRHRNGTIVSLNATLNDGTIRQTTNGKVTHTEKVCQSRLVGGSR